MIILLLLFIILVINGVIKIIISNKKCNLEELS